MNWIGGARKRMQNLKKTYSNPSGRSERGQFSKLNKEKKQLYQLTNDQQFLQYFYNRIKIKNKDIANLNIVNRTAHQQSLMNSIAGSGFLSVQIKESKNQSSKQQKINTSNILNPLKQQTQESEDYQQIIFS